MSADPSIKALTIVSSINEHHRLAHRAAKDAIQHAIKCGQLLTEQKAQLKHGRFMLWVRQNCEFKYSTAARYIQAAKQSSTGVEISVLRGLFPSGRTRPREPANKSQRVVKKNITTSIEVHEPESDPSPDVSPVQNMTIETAFKTLRVQKRLTLSAAELEVRNRDEADRTYVHGQNLGLAQLAKADEFLSDTNMLKRYVEFVTERPGDVSVNGMDLDGLRKKLKHLNSQLTQFLEAIEVEQMTAPEVMP